MNIPRRQRASLQDYELLQGILRYAQKEKNFSVSHLLEFIAHSQHTVEACSDQESEFIQVILEQNGKVLRVNDVKHMYLTWVYNYKFPALTTCSIYYHFLNHLYNSESCYVTFTLNFQVGKKNFHQVSKGCLCSCCLAAIQLYS